MMPHLYIFKNLLKKFISSFFFKTEHGVEQRKKWVAPPLDDEKFEWMRKLLAAPSPVGFEAAMYATCTRPYLYKSIASRTIYPNLSAFLFFVHLLS